MNTTITILFYVKRAKANTQGLAPIFQRITIDGKRLESSKGKFVFPYKWSTEMSKMKGNSEEARIINSHLEMLRAIIYETEKKLFIKQVPITFDNFKNEITGVKECERMLVSIFEEHNRKIKELVGQEYAPGTYERYQTSLKHTKDFLLWKYNFTDINIEKIDHSFITEYEFYLCSVRKCANNTAVKYIKNFHK
jgi:hypothetical protein